MTMCGGTGGRCASWLSLSRLDYNPLPRHNESTLQSDESWRASRVAVRFRQAYFSRVCRITSSAILMPAFCTTLLLVAVLSGASDSGSTRFEGQRPTAANALAELRATTRLRVSQAPRFVRHSVFVYRAARALRGLARPELPRFFKVPAGLPA